MHRLSNTDSDRNSNVEVQETEEAQNKYSIINGIKVVINNCQFLLMCGGMTCLYYVATGVMYWVTDYLITELKHDKSEVFIMVSLISVTGPVIGTASGGYVIAHFGGYNDPRALRVIIINSLVCVITSAPIPFLNNFYVVIGLFWVFLFSGSFMLPTLMGIMINRVDDQFKTQAIAIANIAFTFFGILPAPFVYGIISDAG